VTPENGNIDSPQNVPEMKLPTLTFLMNGEALINREDGKFMLC